jgi:hypothetical protein
MDFVALGEWLVTVRGIASCLGCLVAGGLIYSFLETMGYIGGRDDDPGPPLSGVVVDMGYGHQLFSGKWDAFEPQENGFVNPP